jgi:hypothetical protein
MAITSIDSYLAATKTKVNYMKTTAVTAVAGGFTSMLAVAGSPSALSLVIGNTTTGIVPVAGGTGFPALPTSFANTGYISTMGISMVQGLLRVFDRLFHAGAFAFNASAVTLSTQPSFSARLPGGSYVGTELWFEAATAFTGIPTVTVTYTNQAGTTGRTTGAVNLAVAPILARCYRIPLAAGDTGIQTIESVTCTVATVGTFNLWIGRPLFSYCSSVALANDLADLTKTGLPQIFATTALFPLICPASTSSGSPVLDFEVCDG